MQMRSGCEVILDKYHYGLKANNDPTFLNIAMFEHTQHQSNHIALHVKLLQLMGKIDKTLPVDLKAGINPYTL